MRDKIFLIVSVNDYGYICLKDNLKCSILFFLSFFMKDKDKQYWCSVITTPLGSKNNFHLWYEASSFTPQGSAAFYNLRALDTEWCPFANHPLCANFLSS